MWPACVLSQAIEELYAYPHIEEAAVLSTCNRMELYVVALSWHRGVAEVCFCVQLFSENAGGLGGSLRRGIYLHYLASDCTAFGSQSLLFILALQLRPRPRHRETPFIDTGVHPCCAAHDDTGSRAFLNSRLGSCAASRHGL